METLSRDPLKPHLVDSLLYAQNLPGDIKDKDIRHIFKDFEVSRIQIISAKELNGGNWRRRQTHGGKGGTKVARVEFSSIAVAEKALAILNLRLIPDSEPPVLLMLSPSRDQSPLSPESTFSGNPRLVKFLPSHYTDVQLYMLIRPFGSLASARVEHTLGGVVQFWNEGAARAAEVAVRSVFARTSKITLQAYDPCNIFCTNLCPDVDESSLKPLFEPFGLVTSIRVMRGNKGQSRGYGFVAFNSPGEASNAIHALQGALLGSKSLVLRYHEPKVLSKPATQPIPSKTEDSGTTLQDRSTSSGSQTSGWGGSEKSSEATADSSHISETVPEEVKRQYEEEKQRYEEEKEKYEEELGHLRAELAESHSLRSSEREETEGLRSQLMRLEEQVSGLTTTLREAERDRDTLRAQSDEWRRKFTITDSRLKIVELEGDRPLWEEAKRKREMKEKEEAERVEKARRKAEILESERKMRELREQEKKRMLEEKARKAREEAERKAREREIAEEKEKARLKEVARLNRWKAATRAEQERCRTRDVKLWGNVSEWANGHALERVTLIGAEFSQAKFSESLPLTFENIPWPVLKDPTVFDIDDITWNNVEAFFASAKRTQGADKYKKFVETIHRLFHPDKWRARRALESVMDVSLRENLEKAGNIVSQAITPLWRETKNTV